MNVKSPLSVAIITQDEADNLPRCLESIGFAEQIVIVDSGSSDDTVKIARDAGCDVFLEPWRGGFGAQKQFAIDRCRNPWIMVLDADERIPPETAAAIRDIVTNITGSVAGYSFPRKNFFQGRWIRHAGWWPDRIVRLFEKDSGMMSRAAVHEGVEVKGEIGSLDVPIEHFTESRLSRIILKIDRYSTLGAQEAFREGKTSSTASALLRAVLTFMQDYFLRLGILDGSPGLTLAITDSVNKFFKYAKLAELYRKEARR
ncbi:MAG: glycosyltransferase family 2 protein [Syntrophales bacterium]|nr:glycosyltransferase family 2 protein [Syntrophales bacterium]